MDMLVYPRNMEPAVDPVYTIIGKEEEQWYAEDEVRPAIVLNLVVQPCPASYFAEEEGYCKHDHAGEGP